MKQCSTLLTILVVIQPSSYFYHHIKNSRALTTYSFSHHFHRLLCECFCEVANLFWFDYDYDSWCSLLVSSTWCLCEDGPVLCQCPNLATCYGWLIIFDGALFLMAGYYRSEAKLPWADKCICNYVSAFASSFYSSPPFFSFLLLFQTTTKARSHYWERNIG